MASRSKGDLNEILVNAYDKACIEYLSLYPDLPQPFITCTYRSDEEQNELYALSRTKKGARVTNAKAGQSPHNYKPSFAFDIAFITIKNKLDWSAILFKQFADIITLNPIVVWGKDWNGNKIKDKNDFDAPHFELKDWIKYI